MDIGEKLFFKALKEIDNISIRVIYTIERGRNNKQRLFSWKFHRQSERGLIICSHAQ